MKSVSGNLFTKKALPRNYCEKRKEILGVTKTQQRHLDVRKSIGALNRGTQSTGKAILSFETIYQVYVNDTNIETLI